MPHNITNAPPRYYAHPARPVDVLLETVPGSGIFEPTDKLVAVSVTRGSDEVIDTADLRVLLDEATLGTYGLPEAFVDFDGNRRLQVVANHSEAELRVCLFEGYMDLTTLAWGESPEDHQQGIMVHAEGMVTRWQFDPQTQIIGRWVHGGLPSHEDPDDGGPVVYTEQNLRLLETQGCVFNEGGIPNCSPIPIPVTLSDGVGGVGGVSVPLYVFMAEGHTDEGTQAAIPWTFAKALTYLLVMYGRFPYFNLGMPLPIELPLAFLQRLAETGSIETPPSDNPANVSDLFVRAMLTRPEDFSVDQTNLREAIVMACKEADSRFWIASENIGGVCRSAARIQVSGTGANITLNRQAPRTNPSSNARLTLARNRDMAVKIARDTQSVVNVPIVVGGPNVHEITVELVPGWEPLTELDDVASVDIEDAKKAWRPLLPGATASEAEQDRLIYLQSHEEHNTVAHIGRRWVLNEWGGYPGDTYARQNGQFVLLKYNTFDFATLNVAEEQLSLNDVIPRAINARDWVRRKRPFGNLLTYSRADPKPPLVQISFDSGATWEVNSNVDIDVAEAAIRFNTETPLEITPQGRYAPRINMWYAIIEDKFRVRVTASIESDRLVIPRREAPVGALPNTYDDARVPWSYIDRDRSRIISRPELVQEFRDTSALFALESSLGIFWPDSERRDLRAADAYRAQLGQLYADKHFSVESSIQWLDTSREMGQQVTAVGGLVLNFQQRNENEWFFPEIIGIRYHLDAGQKTTLIIGDRRFSQPVAGGPDA